MHIIKRIPDVDTLKMWERDASKHDDGDGYHAGLSDAYAQVRRYMYGNT